MLEIRGKRALVTGAGVRVGRAIADALVDAGVSVAFHHHGSGDGAVEGVARAHAAGVQAVALEADLLDDPQLWALPARAAEALGGLDLLVNSAALFEKTAFEAIELGALDRMLQLNFKAPFRLAQAALPQLREAGGCIINLLDIAAERPWVGYAHYCAAKAALRMLTLGLAKELAPGVRVNGIEPGAVLLPVAEAADPALVAQRRGRIPLKREGSPRDVAEAALFLWQGAYLTGCILPVDGGARL